MEIIQLQTNPICPKCKKGHTMRVCAFDVLTQEVSYQTECRVRPLVYQAKEMETTNPSEESFYFINNGWISYTSTHGNYAFELTKDAKENAYALNAAYEGGYEVIHTPKPTEEELAALESEEL